MRNWSVSSESIVFDQKFSLLPMKHNLIKNLQIKRKAQYCDDILFLFQMYV